MVTPNPQGPISIGGEREPINLAPKTDLAIQLAEATQKLNQARSAERAAAEAAKTEFKSILARVETLVPQLEQTLPTTGLELTSDYVNYAYFVRVANEEEIPLETRV